MNCNDVRENLVELLAEGQADPALAAHVKGCSACAGELESLRNTMALLDEWEAPEPSPYFLTRLQAHVREEQTKQPAGWLAWFRQPWLASALAAVLVVGSAVYLAIAPPSEGPVNDAQMGAVEDLQSLDKNHDLYTNSVLLDELSGAAPQDVTE